MALAKADGRTDHRELEVIADVLTRLSGEAFEVEDVQRAIDDPGSQPLDVMLKEIAPSLTDEGKVMVIHGLTMVAKADGDVGQGELEILFQAGKVLGIRRADVQKIMAFDDE